MKRPKLFVIGTPIGNKSDLSMRAVQALIDADVIACEDSRVSKKLLDSYGITGKLISYHKFNEKHRTQELKKLLESGKSVALISDAGTPCISDPGRILVKEIFELGIEITAIPGPSAVVTFLSQIPRECEEFAFVGFLPRVKSQQEEVFRKFSFIDTVFYESANRLLDTLKNIKDVLGAQTKVAVGRELTKMYEETLCDTVGNIIKHYETATLKGEVVAMIYATNTAAEDESEILENIEKLRKENFSAKEISTVLNKLFGFNKNKVYKLAIQNQKES